MVIKNSMLSWIIVSDFKKALDFFTKTLGMKIQQHTPEYGWAELTGQEAGGAILGIAQETPQEPIKAGSNSVMTFSVDDVVKTKNELAKKGVKFLGEIIEIPGHVKMQLFSDPDGNLFQLVELLDHK